MNLVLDMNSRFLLPNEHMLDYTWLGGAVAGLRVVRLRDADWKWAPFIVDIMDTLEMVDDIKEIPPGEEPEVGSVLDSLGGYVSIAGVVRPEGLYFPVPREAATKVIDQIPGIPYTYHADGWMLIPREALESFSCLVPLRGPLETYLQEDSNHD
ncbi:MAG: hypothetical protein ACFFED_11945 [Candidatus Thorarchaeota archaeon]